MDVDQKQMMETGQINLMDFPNEILLKIFYNLGDFALLRVTRVCHRLKAVAKETFSKKYDGALKKKYFQLNVSGENLNEERKQYHPLLCTFGDNITAIDIQFRGKFEIGIIIKFKPKYYWLIGTIQSYCQSTTKANISSNGEEVDLTNIILFMPNLTHLCLQNITLLNDAWTKYTYPKLTHFSVSHVGNVNNKMLTTFIMKNQQLEDVDLSSFQIEIGVLNTLKQLKSLNIGALKITNNCSVLKMDNLKSLTVSISTFHTLAYYRDDGCKNVEYLNVECHGDLLLDDINILCSFDGLKTLILCNESLKLELVKALMLRLTLVSLTLYPAENLFDSHDGLLDIASTCLKLSDLTIETGTYLPMLSYDFYNRFAGIIECNRSNLKMEIRSYNTDRIVMTREEARLVREDENHYESTVLCSVLYWKGYDAAYNQSNTNLLQLENKVLENIVSYLHLNDLRAFHQTCKQTQQLVKEHLSQNIVYSSAHPTKFIHENIYKILGGKILRMAIDFLKHSDLAVYEVDDNVTELKRMKFIKDINQHCENLVELEIKHEFVSETVLSWPNLKKLKFSSYGIITLTLQKFHCPKLTHLEIDFYARHLFNVSIDWTHSFRNVTSLKFGFYNEHVEQLLSVIIPTISHQLNELSLGPNKDCMIKEDHQWMKLINIITSIEQLVGLHIHFKGIHRSNFNFLFENSLKLVELSIFCTDEYMKSYIEMFRSIQVNCNQIKVIQLVGKSSAFEASFLEKVYSMFRKTKINLINVDANERY